MVIEYDADTDMLYIQLNEGVSVESEEIAPGVVIDLDEQGSIIGIEIEDASERFNLSRLELKGLPLADLVLRDRLPQAA
ncbi:MAG TPA: DUF2283 domain-containing protein [Anaerolineae bacterium]|nr:DUF2283 domain-containing protein [Anaerolineae bacterium]